MREKAESFQQLEVWGIAHSLVIKIYDITKLFPSEEKYLLVPQIRRAAVSVPANIAEGFKKRTIRDKVNFYNIAQGSLEEVRYYLILSKDLGYLKENDIILSLADRIGKMLYGLISSLNA